MHLVAWFRAWLAVMAVMSAVLSHMLLKMGDVIARTMLLCYLGQLECCVS
jgi:hypothetical protein